MITVVTHWWRSSGYHTNFRAEHVNVLRRMVARNYDRPHRFVCVTDEDPKDLDPEIVVVPLGMNDLGLLQNPSTRKGPSCYRRLRLFAKDAAEVFGGERLVALDLDTVILKSMVPLWDRDDDLVLWRDPLFHDVRYNGSMMLLRAGSCPDVWEDFDPGVSPRITRRTGLFGTDQAWISYKLGPGYPTWGRAEGVYSFRLMTEQKLRRRMYTEPLPERVPPHNARVVFFHGHKNPWDEDVQGKYHWVRENWR